MATFTATLYTAGTQVLGASDVNNSTIAGEQDGIVVTPAAVSQLVVTGFPSPITAGTPGTFTVTVEDAYGNVVTDFSDRIAFYSSDSQASLPPSYQFTPGDQGSHTFTATLFTAGTQSIGAIDVNNPSVAGEQDGIEVDPASATALIVSGFPSPVQAGMPGQFSVTAVDLYGNVDTNYTGTITFYSSDPAAQLPPDYTFTSVDGGSHIFTATLFTPGTQSIGAYDVDNPDIAGEQDNIIVNGAGPVRGGHGLRFAGDMELASAGLGPAATPAVGRGAVISSTVATSATTESLRRFAPAAHGGNRQPVVGTFSAAAGPGSDACPGEAVDVVLAAWDDSMVHGLLVDEQLLPW